MTSNESSNTVDKSAKEYHLIKARLNYYEKLMEKGSLTEKQQQKYDYYTNKFKEFPEPKKKHKYATKEDYLLANKQRALERYYKLKNNEEFQQTLKEYRKRYYQSHHQSMNPTIAEPIKDCG